MAEMREMGVGIYGTAAETADVGDLVRTIIVDSTVTCRMKRGDVVDDANIRPGDVMVRSFKHRTGNLARRYRWRGDERTYIRTPRCVQQIPCDCREL